MPTPTASGSPFTPEFSSNFGSGAAASPPPTRAKVIAELRTQLAQAVALLNTISASLGKLS